MFSTFLQTFGPFATTENEVANTTVGKVSAEDKDVGPNAEIVYSITGQNIISLVYIFIPKKIHLFHPVFHPPTPFTFGLVICLDLAERLYVTLSSLAVEKVGKTP